MKTIMAIVNKWGELVCELERDGDFFYKVSEKDIGIFSLLCEGDEFRVEEIVTDN